MASQHNALIRVLRVAALYDSGYTGVKIKTALMKRLKELPNWSWDGLGTVEDLVPEDGVYEIVEQSWHAVPGYPHHQGPRIRGEEAADGWLFEIMEGVANRAAIDKHGNLKTWKEMMDEEGEDEESEEDKLWDVPVGRPFTKMGPAVEREYDQMTANGTRFGPDHEGGFLML